MIFKELKCKGAYLINFEKHEDNRGFFARSWDKTIFEKNGIKSIFVQNNISFNNLKGTIRGLHYQASPYEEAKLIRCTRGRAYEVFVDIRKKSKTYLKWMGIELSSDELTSLYVPKGFALGFQTLEDNTELFYQMSQFYKPEYSRGIIWNDKKLNISWPIKMTVISEKDLSLPSLNQAIGKN